jgi:eukaryotic-like serine/threonine-protein kinase
MDRIRRAACVAVRLRPPGFDAEVVALLAMLQNLGRLLLQYHSADEALQIRRLMASAPSDKPGEPPQPGMSEEAAAFSVIGLDIESLGLAVARRWGFEEDILLTLRRWPAQTPPHAPDGDSEQLRLVASCANELLDLQLLPPQQQAAGLHRVAQRYTRVLHLQPKDLQTALQESASANLGQALLSGSGNALYAAAPTTTGDEVQTEPHR